MRAVSPMRKSKGTADETVILITSSESKAVFCVALLTTLTFFLLISGIAVPSGW